MFSRILNLITGNYNQKQIDKLLPIVNKTNVVFEEYEALSDDQIKAKTKEFKDRITKGETLDSILPEAFATVKQACKRMLGQEIEVKGTQMTRDMVPYNVQLLGWIILHKGTISEMKTWEGKTLVAVMPVYLNALTGKGVHVVTVNDYLASRDAQRMGYVYEWLWLTCGCVTKSVPLQNRRSEYSKDITYIENSELGFDYLRDNLVRSKQQRSLLRRPLNYAIVDEIDSILIDEARTPLIISEASAEPTEKYVYYAKIVKTLTPCSSKKKVSKGLLHELMNEKTGKQEEDGDYYIDVKTKTAALSWRWIQRLEEILGVENLYRDIGYEEIHHMENALRAEAVYEKDKEYIVKDNEVLIVDEHTGRTMPGRRFSEWLHQAIEAKEAVEIQKESKTMATITYQNFFKQYKKLCGMTGTALTEGEEFEKIYDLSVLEIPTNKPTIRVDKNDKVYFNQAAKWKFVKEYIKFYHEMGQPILIGTSNIATSEFVDRILEKETITHYVLNAKFHEQEAHIVSQAGKYKSVVVATNMAWRGTDIKLEKWLNNKLAENYAKRINKTVKSWKAISAVMYSWIEYELTMDWLKKELSLTDEQIRQSEIQETAVNDMTIKVKFNKGKKANTTVFAEIIIKPANGQHTELIEKDFHYGLFILGTEKHESRRIDNQLRGRAGRQGDPGISVFFVALDDLIMQKMWGERIQSMAALLLGKAELENLELTQSQFTNSIIRAQKQMEGRHFGIRKHLFDYDSVIDKQRQAIYHKRDEIIESEENPEIKKLLIEEMKWEIERNMWDIVNTQIHTAKTLNQTTEEFIKTMDKIFSLKLSSEEMEKYVGMNYEALQEPLAERVTKHIQHNMQSIDQERMYLILKDVYLYHIDTLRVKHIDEMDYLRDKVGLMGYAQLDPLIVYKKEAFDKFQNLLYNLKLDISTYIAGIDFAGIHQQEELQQLRIANQTKDNQYVQLLQKVSQQVKAAERKIPQSPSISESPQKMVYENQDGFEVFETKDGEPTGVPETHVIDMNPNQKTRPNDPCPCGSGKKYKKCCRK